MCEDMQALLSAYLDGELHGVRLLEMKMHLASCESCRNQLKELRLVSDILRAAPAPAFTPTERFVSQMTLQLPRRPLADRPPKPGSLIWWLVPLGLMGVWFFVQTVFSVGNVVTVADATGLMGHISTFFSAGAAQHTLWFQAAEALFGNNLGGTSQTTASFLDQASQFFASFLSQFLWQAVIVLVYWGWLTVGWLIRRPSMQVHTQNFSRSH